MIASIPSLSRRTKKIFGSDLNEKLAAAPRRHYDDAELAGSAGKDVLTLSRRCSVPHGAVAAAGIDPSCVAAGICFLRFAPWLLLA
jgi:hypothetical protein